MPGTGAGSEHDISDEYELFHKTALAATGAYDHPEQANGWSEAPSVVQTADGNDRAHIGVTKIGTHDRCPMVAVRGTVNETLRQLLIWLQNLDVRMINLERKLTRLILESPDPEVEFSVHSGFADALNRLFAVGLKSSLKEANEKCDPGNKRVIVTGHSKGGGVGLLLALELLRFGWNVTLVTFGAPPVGWQEYS